MIKFGTDTYGDYISFRPYYESQREAIEWYPYPDWRRIIANLFVAPYKLGHWLSRKSGIGWHSQ